MRWPRWQKLKLVWNYFKPEVGWKILSQASRSRKEKAGKWYLIPRLPENPGNRSPDHPCFTGYFVALLPVPQFCYVTHRLATNLSWSLHMVKFWASEKPKCYSPFLVNGPLLTAFLLRTGIRCGNGELYYSAYEYVSLLTFINNNTNYQLLYLFEHYTLAVAPDIIKKFILE